MRSFFIKIFLKTVRTFLDGITAGVAGLIAADVLDILGQILISKLTIGIFIASLVFLFLYKSPYAIIWIVLMGGLLSTIVSVI
ncbi:MAG TPA: chromate transporter [Candidatus Babeliales bacterium]|nr:chromate transporter [Candidatus Babeliales bacterium]